MCNGSCSGGIVASVTSLPFSFTLAGRHGRQRDEGFASLLRDVRFHHRQDGCTNRLPAVKRLRSTAAICQELPLPPVDHSAQAESRVSQTRLLPKTLTPGDKRGISDKSNWVTGARVINTNMTQSSIKTSVLWAIRKQAAKLPQYNKKV